MTGKPNAIKRFYGTVAVEESAETYVVLLDGRAAKTPAGNTLAAATSKLAHAAAAEWDAQQDIIQPDTMPLTKTLSRSLDADADTVSSLRSDILQYLGTDLLCYRADNDTNLAARQAAVWDPYLAWFAEFFGAELATTTGIAAVTQPEAAIVAVRRALDELPTPTLFAVKEATALAGSAVLALAASNGQFDAEALFEASRLDERFQEERWGVDTEAKAREEAMRRDFLAMAELMRSLKTQ